MRRYLVLGLLGVAVVCALAGDGVQPQFDRESDLALNLERLNDEAFDLSIRRLPDLRAYNQETGEPPKVEDPEAFRKAHLDYLQTCKEHEAACQRVAEENPRILAVQYAHLHARAITEAAMNIVLIDELQSLPYEELPDDLDPVFTVQQYRAQAWRRIQMRIVPWQGWDKVTPNDLDETDCGYADFFNAQR